MELCIPKFFMVYMPQNEPHWSTILAALSTPAIALLGAIIALNQWLTARRKLKLDLYEKKSVVYEAVKSAISRIIATGKTNQDVEWDFLVGISGAGWLFDKKMVKYLSEEIWAEIVNLGMTQAMTDGAPPSEEKLKYIKDNSDAKIRLNKKLRGIDERFSPFLSLRH